jgi:hypothetical protein
MTKDQIYDAWKPANSPWSAWVKPVLFSYIEENQAPASADRFLKLGIPPSKDTAIVVNLAGAKSVGMGLSLCEQAGFRPIPVFNACPSTLAFVPVLVDVASVVAVLAALAEDLIAAHLPVDAPPAFLIDEARQGKTWNAKAPSGWFDNRSFVTPSDFPSAGFLKQNGIARVIVIQERMKVMPDLRSVLSTWQRGGITIAMQSSLEEWCPRVFDMKPLSWIANIWQRLRWKVSYRRNPLGEFGEYVLPSSS